MVKKIDIRTYDVAVIGLGIVGSSILANLSSNHNVIGIDQFKPPHNCGSSHGENRIIRAAPGTSLIYAQLAGKSFRLFDALSEQCGFPLIHKTGGFDTSTLPSDWTETAKKTCEYYKLPFEEISGKELNKRYGNFNLPGDLQVILQPEYGHVNAETTWEVFLNIARKNNAEISVNRKISSIDFSDVNTIQFEDGTIITANKVICAAGSWINQLLDIQLDLTIGRRVLAWYNIEQNQGDILPFVFIDEKNNARWYGMPSLDKKCIKIGEHGHFCEEVNADDILSPDNNDAELLNIFIKKYTKGIASHPVKMATCKYTLTHNENFIIDRHPEHKNVFIFSCCSGHGFKYAPVYGEIAEYLINDRPYEFDLSLFKIDSHITNDR